MSNVVPPTLKYEDNCPQHRSALLHYGIRFTGQSHTAEDLVQETLTRAYVFWSQFKPATGDVNRDVLVWLKRILANIFYTQCQRDKRRSEAITEYGDELSLGESEDTEFVGKTRELVQRLKPDYKEIIELHYVDGLSYQEIADRLVIPFTKVQKRLWKARQALKKTMLVAGLVNPSTLKSSKSPQTESDSIDGIMGGDDTLPLSDRESATYTSTAR